MFAVASAPLSGGQHRPHSPQSCYTIFLTRCVCSRALFHRSERGREIYYKYKLGFVCACELSQAVQEETQTR